MRSDTYQVLLIASGLLVAGLFGAFLYREIFPEYKIYQDDYLSLEEFRSTYTHQALPPFQTGIKQIVIEREDLGPAMIDRCTSCHVALEIPYFSPTKIASDLNGNKMLGPDGHPLLVPNEEYIWLKLDQKIAELRDEQIIAHLNSQGNEKEVQDRLKQALKYESLKTASVGDLVYDVTKVLAMHPLIGNESRPFEFHPIEEYGCTSCHNGNGRGLTTDKAHGPVFDDQYEIEERPTPKFTESDPKNDPVFARIFNHKPGHSLLFQTEPIFVGPLIQSRCMDCHQTSPMKMESHTESTTNLYQKSQNKFRTLIEQYENDKQVVLKILFLREMISKEGYEKTFQYLTEQRTHLALPEKELKNIAAQLHYLEKFTKGQSQDKKDQIALDHLNNDLINFIGSEKLVKNLETTYALKGESILEEFLKQNQQSPAATGLLFTFGETIQAHQDLMRHAKKEAEKSFKTTAQDQKAMTALTSEIDELTENYQRGKELYFSQACYACHRIAGLTRGGVGPELTRIGHSYPWYIKESIVWPQADLATSTMPNMRLDHLELQDVMTFLLAQRGGNRAIAKTAYQADLQAWEAGKKLPWEKPISPSEMYDVRYAMKIFATEGCASCHRLQGFESNVGFKIEKDSPSFEKLYEQQSWFKKLFPEIVHYSYYDEELPGSEIVGVIEKNAKDIDERIVSDVRKNGILEEIDRSHHQVIESLYSPFRFAFRAKDDDYQEKIKKENDPEKITQLNNEWKGWKDRVHKVLMVYIQTYGLGRLIGPHLNWSGIYRSDEWLMEHFHNPSGHVPRSIMPVFPFDDTKFYALTHMLDVLGIQNRNSMRQIWNHQGFSPEEAYVMLCSQCHGIDKAGNGVIAEWIYPIPKNLHDPTFLRNLTREKAIESITHGVKGTPMAPWGEVSSNKSLEIQKFAQEKPTLSANEIDYFVDWLFTGLSGGEIIRDQSDVPKWQYTPEDFLKELEKEGGHLTPLPNEKKNDIQNDKLPDTDLPVENNPPPTIDRSTSFFLNPQDIYYASIKPEIYSRQEPKEKKQKNTVEDVFDVIPKRSEDGEQSYFIKKKFYTPYNLEEGQKFFLLNCAVCHGNEGDGTGSRAQAMKSAKPRMLTNLDWIQSRDDLRLLRSMKYGVPGTSMTPWGDLTNALQRLQLVAFIRSLSEEQELRDDLSQTLYQTFESAQLTVEEARIQGNEEEQTLLQKKKELKDLQQELEDRPKEDKTPNTELLQIYDQLLELKQKLNAVEVQDHQYITLKSKLKSERDDYFVVGVNLLSKNLKGPIFNTYLDLIRKNAHRYSLQDHHLTIHHNKQVDEDIRNIRNVIVEELEKKITELEKKRLLIEGKISSSLQKENLSTNQADIDSFTKIKAKLITDTEDAIRLANEQVKIVETVTNKK